MKYSHQISCKIQVLCFIVHILSNCCHRKDSNIAVVVEAWMSNNIGLLYKSFGKEKDEKAEKYDPLENLKALHASYPECCVYLSMLSFTQDWQEILPRLKK